MTTKSSTSLNNNSSLYPWTENSGLKKLSTLLRNEGDRVLNGSSTFTLTTEVLAQLNTDCRRHSVSENDIITLEMPSNNRTILPPSSRLRVQHEAYEAKAEWSRHIQFIKDFMLSTPSLKLIRYSGTLSSPISLHRFGNLTCLSLQKVPIHMVEGLHKVRGALISITVYRSVDKVKDLLEFCGGDMTAPSIWPQLKFVSFMFNSISALDDSLRLLPHVEMIDLSHNSLETCNRFLEYLGDVQRITLAYNFLRHVPSVSLRSRASLTCMILRGNNLDNVNGLEVLTALQELDLGENCISDHHDLGPLGFLIRLQQLQLDGNPIFYHKLHRQLTVASLARQAATLEFELDKRKLTASEISKAEFTRVKTTHMSTQSVVGFRNHNPDSDYGVSPSSGIGTENESSDSIVSYKSKKKGKRKKLKARNTEIMDMERSGDASSSRDVTPGSSPHPQFLKQQLKTKQEEAMKTKREIEEIRQSYGPNWLQAIKDRDVFNKKKVDLASFTSELSDAEAENIESENTESENCCGPRFIIGSKSINGSDINYDMSSRKKNEDSKSESDNQLRKDGSPTDDDLYLTDSRMSDANNPIMAAIARLAAGHHSTDDSDGGKNPNTSLNFSAFETQTGFIEENKSLKSAETFNNNVENDKFIDEKLSSSCPVLEEKANIDTVVVEASNQTSSNTNFDTTNQVNVTEPISTSKTVSQPSNEISLNKASLSRDVDIVSSVKSEGEASSKKSTSDLNSSLTPESHKCLNETETNSSNSSVLLEKEEVAESMFATLPLQDNEMIIMTLTASYLVEKDVTGKVKEKLELASLIDMKWKIVKKTNDVFTAKSDQVLGEHSDTKLDMNGAVSDEDLINGNSKQDERTEYLQLDLKFDYVRKDKQNRCYVVDTTDGKIIRAHLQPFLDSRGYQEKAQSMVVMQCLKCNRTFLKSEMIQQRSQLPTSGSSKDLESIQELMSKTTLICPKCRSSIIIELEPSSTVRSAASTPVGSYTSSSGSYMEQIKRPASLSKKNADRMKDSQPRLPGVTMTRDRNSAFVAPSKMGRSAILGSGEHKISEDQLVCVEDHFSPNTMTTIQTSSHSTDMTTSLLGDSSTRGSKAFVRRESIKESHSRVFDPQESGVIDFRQKILVDGEYRSGIINSMDEPTRPISIKRRVSSFDDERIEKKDEENMQSGPRRTFIHNNLAVMEDIVNSLVSEGKYLEEQESFGAGSYSSSKGRSVSISTFMRSSLGNNKKASASSVEGTDIRTGLKRSESSSSIAVIPTVPSDTNLDTLTIMHTRSSSVPEFSEDALIDRDDLATNSKKSDNAIVSPLSSSICSSMVSSVYETSMNNPENIIDNISHDNDINETVNAEDIESTAGGTIVVLNSNSSSSPDLTSIYDHPREPMSSTRKKSLSKQLSLSTATPSKTGDAAIGTVSLVSDSQTVSETTSEEPPSQKLSSLTTTTTYVALPGSDSVVDEGNDIDEENDQDVIPKYAFHHLNHRLTLYMMMSLFGTDEGFVCKLQGEVIQYIVQKPYEGILVMASSRFYILKIYSDDHSQAPDQWLHCVEIQPIPELRYIDTGLGGQSFRLEFVTDCSSYTFITRNRDKTIQFVEMLHTNLAKYAVSHGIASHVVVNEDVDPTTLNNLDHDVVSKVTPDQKMLHYCMGFIERGNQKNFSVSFVITTSDVCLVSTNHQWPQPRLQAQITEETVGKQFTVLERQKVSNIASVEVCEATMKKIRLELFNETEGVSTCWNITLASRQSTVDFINALSEPWAKEFGVEMDVVYSELSF